MVMSGTAGARRLLFCGSAAERASICNVAAKRRIDFRNISTNIKWFYASMESLISANIGILRLFAYICVVKTIK
jgi:hypothetical protein